MFLLIVAVVLILLFWPKPTTPKVAVPLELAPPVVVAPKPSGIEALGRVKSELVRRGSYSDEAKAALSVLTVALVSGDGE